MTKNIRQKTELGLCRD